MNYTVLFTVLAVYIGVIGYVVLVFKLSEWCSDNDDSVWGIYSFFVWMMGYVGLPLAIAAGLFAN